MNSDMNLKMAGVVVAGAAALVACGGGEHSAATSTSTTATEVRSLASNQSYPDSLEGRLQQRCVEALVAQVGGDPEITYHVMTSPKYQEGYTHAVNGGYVPAGASGMRAFGCNAKVQGETIIDLRLDKR